MAKTPKTWVKVEAVVGETVVATPQVPPQVPEIPKPAVVEVSPFGVMTVQKVHQVCPYCGSIRSTSRGSLSMKGVVYAQRCCKSCKRVYRVIDSTR
jgi:hypothetical protein